FAQFKVPDAPREPTTTEAPRVDSDLCEAQARCLPGGTCVSLNTCECAAGFVKLDSGGCDYDPAGVAGVPPATATEAAGTASSSSPGAGLSTAAIAAMAGAGLCIVLALLCLFSCLLIRRRRARHGDGPSVRARRSRAGTLRA